MAIFLTGCFWANLARKYRLFYILDKKRTLSRQEMLSFKKVQKNPNFPKGLVHGFGLKLAIFPSFYFSQYRPGKICFTIS